MRIGILTHGISPFGYLYARAFERAGHEAEILSLTGYRREWPAVRMRCIGWEGFKPWESSARWPYLRTILPVRRALREAPPDVVFAVFLSSAGVIGCLSGHPAVAVSAQGCDVNTRVESALWKRIYRWEARRSCLVHSVSDDLAEKLVRDFGVAREKVFVSAIGIDTAAFPLIDPASRPDRGCIVSTRAHEPVYSQETLVRALRLLRDRGVACRVTFASDREVERTEECVRREGVADAVDFVGGYEYAELPEILGGADVYVSASLRDGTSLSLLEAMCTGTFPVVSDIAANRPWIKHGANGLLFPVGDAEALARALERAFADPDLRARAAATNRQAVLERGDLFALGAQLARALERSINGAS